MATKKIRNSLLLGFREAEIPSSLFLISISMNLI
jgi:hypothetical protein